MAKNNKKLINDINLITLLINEYNHYIDCWNEWEEGEIEKSKQGERATTKFVNNGKIEVYGSYSPNIVHIFFLKDKNLVYMLKTKRSHSMWKKDTIFPAGSFLKSIITIEDIKSVWMEIIY